MSTSTTVPLSALRTSSAPATDWTLRAMRAHCLRSPGVPALVGPLGVVSEGAGAGVTDGVGGAITAAGGAGLAAGVAAPDGVEVLAVGAAAAGGAAAGIGALPAAGVDALAAG